MGIPGEVGATDETRTVSPIVRAFMAGVLVLGLLSPLGVSGQADESPRNARAHAANAVRNGVIAISSYLPGDDWQGLPVTQIHTIDPVGGERTPLTASPPTGCTSWCSSTDPAWSPDGTTIAFTSDRDGGYEDNDIYLMAHDGRHLVRLTDNAGYHSQLAWSPDGSRIAFVFVEGYEFEDYVHDVFVVDVASGDQSRLTEDQELERHPAWAPDGVHIAFSDGRDIVLASPEGAARPLTSDGGGATAPTWSPDGGRLAFSSGGDIHVVEVASGSRTQLTESGADDFPVWSPDGTRIAFQSRRDGNDEIYVMRADGDEEVNLTGHAAADRRPVWSPDGTGIAFTTSRDGPTQIYLVDPDGGSPENLTNSRSFDSRPSWQPVAVP